MGHNASWIGVAYHVITLSKSHDCEYVGPQMSHHILVEIPRKYINKVSELANPWIHLCWSLHSLLVYVVVCYIVDLPCVHISHAIPPFHFILFYVWKSCTSICYVPFIPIVSSVLNRWQTKKTCAFSCDIISELVIATLGCLRLAK